LISTPREDLFDIKDKIYTPKKTVSEWWLSKMSPLSIAIWYMDDGSLIYKNKIRSYFSFATNCFSIEEHYLLKKFMESQYEIKTEIKSFKKSSGKHQYNLVICDDSFGDFQKLIEPHVIDSMMYKLPGKIRQQFLKKNIKSDISKESLKDMYINKRMTQKQIAEAYGVHRLTISKYMGLFNIKVRNNVDSQLGGKTSRTVRGLDGRFYPSQNTLDEISKSEIIFRELRKNDFPYAIPSSDESYMSLLESLCNKSCIENNGVFKYSQAGLKISSDFCPQIFHMAVKGSMSPFDIFNNDRMLMDCIRRTIKYAKKETISAIRSGLKTYKGNRGVSNFPPLWCKAVLSSLFCDRNDIALLDFCCGFGGRLLGAYAHGGVNHYCGIDPLKDNIDSLSKISSLISKHAEMSSRKFDVELINNVAERALCDLSRKYDIVLTSPPYFDKEIYSKSNSQSYNRFTEKEAWVDMWLKDVIEKSYNCLRENGYMAIFIGEDATLKQLCINIIEQTVGTVHEILFEIPKIEYNRKHTSRKFDTCLVAKV
jgi:tRNA1(Val) A37 N6-methylase TrmN6